MNKKVLIVGLAAVLALAGSFAACGKGGDSGAKAAATTPMADLIKAGRPPVTVAPTFTVSVTNVSDCPITLLKGMVMFFDENGALLPDTKQESGYGDLSPIRPGEKIELSMMTGNEKAASGKWIIQEVVYEKPSPLGKNMGTIDMRWTNAAFEAELAAAEAKKQ
jgi:hypothetical protein